MIDGGGWRWLLDLRGSSSLNVDTGSDGSQSRVSSLASFTGPAFVWRLVYSSQPRPLPIRC
jgi:hypothetical protein